MAEMKRVSSEAYEESDDYYFEAQEAETLKERKALLLKTIKVNPFHFDALRELVDFWECLKHALYETRHDHFLELIEVGHIHQAILEDMLTMFLNESHNLDVRYTIFPLFIIAGDLEDVNNPEFMGWFTTEFDTTKS